MAAAYAALLSLLSNLKDIQNHPRHSFSFDNNQIQSLIGSVTFLIEFMESYDNCHGSSKEASQLLERPITCAARAAEEVIESHVVEKIRGGSTLGGKTRLPHFLMDLEKVIEDMDYVKRNAIKVQKARRRLELKLPTYSAAASSSEQPLTYEKTTMVGFDDLLLQLFDLLIGYPSSRRVIPIVGTGGVGKTTLALNAFESSIIERHFDVCLWATISQQYVVLDILVNLLSRKEESISETIGELGEQLHKRLYGRRYLIVLDDMWSITAWEDIKFLFPDTNDGSRIVVTTRQSDVADHLGSSHLAIGLLDDNKSWDLFCQKSFVGQGCPKELENVGKNITRKCKGLPLAIVVVAGYLRKSLQTREYWENAANNMKSIWNSVENERLLDILSFSYSHLPVHLKPCFVYMGTFPEDAQIPVRGLIRRWIAEGFLKPSKGKNLEEIAKDYLKDLIDRNLILDSTRQTRRGSTCCKIHDLLRELCLKVAEKELFFYVVNTGRAVCRERQVGKREKSREDAPPLVRSLDWKTGHEQSLDLRLCRLLKYSNVLANEVDGGFLEVALQHVNIRFLKYYVHRRDEQSILSDQCIFLPSSISLFWNLQTLIIGGEPSLFIAPNEFWEMTQLRHLQVRNGIHLPDPLPSDQKNYLVMQNLQTLLGVENFKLSEDVCKRLPNIVELRVTYYDEVRSNYYLENLGCLCKLESLTLKIIFDGDHDSTWREFVLNLTFPSSLKYLSLCDTRLYWEEMTMMIGSLPHLETLYLHRNSVIGSEWTLVEGKFLHLKSLNICFCDDLVIWNADNSHFPLLEILDIWNVSRLNELPSDLGTIPTLRSINLKWCSVSLAICALRMVVEQEEENGNEDLRLDVEFWSGEELKSFNKKVEEEGLKTNNLRSSQV